MRVRQRKRARERIICGHVGWGGEGESVEQSRPRP